MLHSLDPRVQRLPHQGVMPSVVKAPLDQLGTFEVFVQPKEGKPFQHEGAVHSADLELAYVLAKETFTRRFTCVSLYVVSTRDIYSSALTEGNVNAYDILTEPAPSGVEKFRYEIYHLLKRGKQPIHVGQVIATQPPEALWLAKEKLKGDKLVYNMWAIPTAAIRFTSEEEKDLWSTLPEKKFRDAAAYKGGERLKLFLENNKKDAI
jgi:ring-1,2-phenylacetyl-CoA epoxidase subunit PaaB